MALDVDDAALKALQAGNFDNLNQVVADSPFDRHMRFFNFGYRVRFGVVRQGTFTQLPTPPALSGPSGLSADLTTIAW